MWSLFTHKNYSCWIFYDQLLYSTGKQTNILMVFCVILCAHECEPEKGHKTISRGTNIPLIASVADTLRKFKVLRAASNLLGCNHRRGTGPRLNRDMVSVEEKKIKENRREHTVQANLKNQDNSGWRHHMWLFD